MIIERNLKFFDKHFPLVSDFIRLKKDIWLQEPIEIVPSKTGLMNIQLTTPEKTVYFHSQYDPMNEAERLIDKYGDELKNAKHVLFYGIGMGYHVETIVNQYPQIEYSIYDPFPAVFYSMLHHRTYNDLKFLNAKNIYLDNALDIYLSHFVSQTNENVVIIPHPVYERLFNEQYIKFLDTLKKYLLDQRMTIGVNHHLEKLWIINSVSNFSKVLKTPSVIREKKKFFENKPAIIVSAGPSLSEEIENLRVIKEKGTAYILAVGSANKALISAGIYPDAVCSYDPSVYNHNVFEEIINSNIDSIPLIFGSSVGLKTLELYPGPMLHMITTQDKISSFYLGETNVSKDEIVSDAPSIAVLTLELLIKFGCNKIILVGQNFGYKNDQYYSTGIGYSYRKTELSDDDKRDLIEVESVDGGVISTTSAHNTGRYNMEAYVRNAKGIEFINTTTGGAKIQGTTFIPLIELMENSLLSKVVEHEWYKGETTTYDMDYVLAQAEIMEINHKELDRILIDLAKMVKQLETVALLKNINKVKKIFDKFNFKNQQLYDNEYYQMCIQPMVRVEFAIFQKSLLEIQQEKDVLIKAKLVILNFGNYLYSCQLAYRDNDPFFRFLSQQLEEIKLKKMAVTNDGN
jgi:hypothetical protein